MSTHRPTDNTLRVSRSSDEPNVYNPVAPDDRTDNPQAILDYLRQLSAHKAVLTAELDGVENELHWWVIEAFNQGITFRPIMENAGLGSKSRTYQIRDGRR